MEGSFDYWLEQKNVTYAPTCDTLLSCIDSTPENSPQLTSLDSVKFCDFQNYQNCGDQTVSSTVGDGSSSNDLSTKLKVQGFDGTGPLQLAAHDNSLFSGPSGSNLNNEGLYNNHTTGHSSQGHSGSPHSSYSTSPVGSYCNDDLSGSSSRNVSPQISSSEEERLRTNSYQCSTSGNDVQYSGSLEQYYQCQSRMESNAMYSGNVGQLGEGHYGVQCEGHAYQNRPCPSASILYNQLNSAASNGGMQFTQDEQYQIMQEVFQRCQSSQLSHFHQSQSMQVPSYGQSNFQLPYPEPPQCHSSNFSRNQNFVYQGYNFSAGHQGAMPSPAMQSSQYQVTSSVGQVAAPVKRKPRASVNKSRPTKGQGQLKVQGHPKVQGQCIRSGNQGAVEMGPVIKYNLSDFAFKECGKLMGYNCPLCPPYKRFANKSNLKTHIMVHTGEKPFHCPECNTPFRQKAHMMKHRMTHRKEMKNRPIQFIA